MNQPRLTKMAIFILALTAIAFASPQPGVDEVIYPPTMENVDGKPIAWMDPNELKPPDPPAAQLCSANKEIKAVSHLWPERLLLHPDVPVSIQHPTFQTICDPQCEDCTVLSEIQVACRGCQTSTAVTSNKDSISIHGAASLGKAPLELKLVAIWPDGTETNVQSMRVDFVDKLCDKYLFTDIDGLLLRADVASDDVALRTLGPFHNLADSCGLVRFSVIGKCLSLAHQDDNSVVIFLETKSNGECQTPGIYQGGLKVEFDRFNESQRLINFQYALDCNPGLDLIGADARNHDYTPGGPDLFINLGTWRPKSDCGGVVHSNLKYPDQNANEWFKFDAISHLLHVFGQPQNSDAEHFEFIFEALIDGQVISSSHFRVNFEYQATELANQMDALPPPQFEHVRGKGQPRRLPLTGWSWCSNPASLLNLFNTGAIAEQSTFWGSICSYSAVCGCDGRVSMMDTGNPPSNYGLNDGTMAHPATPGTSQYWKVTFPSPTPVKTIGIMNRDNCCQTRITTYTVTVGSNAVPTMNPVCISAGTMTEGGWYSCLASMIGTTVGLYATDMINIMELMAYSQEAIQLNAGVTASFLGTNNPLYPVANVLQKIVVAFVDRAEQKCVLVTPPAGGRALVRITFKCKVKIKGVVMIPGYQASSSSWPSFQTNVAIYGQTDGGAKQSCGILANYYIKYGEILCNILVNEIVVEQQDPTRDLRFCGFAALSDCNCAESSLDPLSFTKPSTPLASATSISVTSTDSVQTITLNTQMPDTVSSTCGSADGFSKCGKRSITAFKDKSTGETITSWPYKGFQWDAATSELTLNPEQASSFVLTVTLSLANYPQVIHSQDINTTVVPPPTPPPPPFKIPNMTLNAKINKEATLQLPTENGAQYIVTSSQDFPVYVIASKLIVLSTNKDHIGVQTLLLRASTAWQTEDFTVTVIFEDSTAKKAISDNSTDSTPKPQVGTTVEKTNLVSSNLADQIEKVDCNDDGVCVDPSNPRFTCQLGDANTPTKCGLDLPKKNTTVSNNAKPPMKIVVSKVSDRGRFEISIRNFVVDFEPLINTTDCARRNKSDCAKTAMLDDRAGFNQSAYSQANSTELDRIKYLLSSKHLNIAIQPSPEHSDDDLARLQFEWYAVNHTDKKIVVQLVFEDPVFISANFHSPDFLKIKLRLPFLEILRSNETGVTIANPHKTYLRRLPKQLIPDEATELIVQSAEASKTIIELTALSSFFVSVFSSSLLAGIRSMTNSFQMTMVLGYLPVSTPSQVLVVMKQLNIVASWNYLPTGWLGQQFGFTETEVPFATFQDMGITSMRLSENLNSFTVAFALILALSIIYLVSWPCKKLTLVSRFQKMMNEKYFWSGVIRLTQSSYYDLCVAACLSFLQPRYDKPGDIYDFIMTILTALLIFLGPTAWFVLMYKNANRLAQDDFQGRYGALTEGLITNELGSVATCYFVFWFFVRRCLTAVVIVFMQDQSQVFIVVAMLLISLADISINCTLNAYESWIEGIIAKFNDFIVFVLSYFPIIYTGAFGTDPELVYHIGTAQCVLIAILFCVNMGYFFQSTTGRATKECRRMRVERFNFKVLKKAGYAMLIVTQSWWQYFARFLQIDWAFFNGIPARLNAQIQPYVQIFLHRQAEQLVDQIIEEERYEREVFERQVAIEKVAYVEKNGPIEDPSESQLRRARDSSSDSDDDFDLEMGQISASSRSNSRVAADEIMIVEHVPNVSEGLNRAEASEVSIDRPQQNQVMPAQEPEQEPARVQFRSRRPLIVVPEVQQQQEEDAIVEEAPIVDDQQLELEDAILADERRQQDAIVEDERAAHRQQLDFEDSIVRESVQATHPIGGQVGTNESQLLPWDAPNQMQVQPDVELLTNVERGKKRKVGFQKINLPKVLRDAENPEQMPQQMK